MVLCFCTSSQSVAYSTGPKDLLCRITESGVWALSPYMVNNNRARNMQVTPTLGTKVYELQSMLWIVEAYSEKASDFIFA